MKIVTKSNFGDELYVEQVVAENMNEYWSKVLVTLYNNKHWTGTSEEYLKVVEDDYKPYNGYVELMGDS